jgi:hypothetical protein
MNPSEGGYMVFWCLLLGNVSVWEDNEESFPKGVTFANLGGRRVGETDTVEPVELLFGLYDAVKFLEIDMNQVFA